MLRKQFFPATILLLGLSSWVAAASGETEQLAQIIPEAFTDTAAITPEDHPLAEQIRSFLKNDLSVEPLGVTRDDYLRIINGQITGMLKYQGEDGEIKNPLTGADRNYATAHFAHCAAVLIHSGYNTSAALREAGAKAMTFAVDRLQEGIHPLQIARRDGTISQKEFQAEVQKWRNNPPEGQDGNLWGAGDFCILPIMKAMPLWQQEVEAGALAAETFAAWEQTVREIDPHTSYNFYLTPTTQRWASNWAIKNGTGEWLREAAGYSDLDYSQVVFMRHQDNFTPFGMFREGAFCYDLFPRTAITTILFKGYRGEYFEKLRDYMVRGAWTSLFVQSPNGELPPGFRSAGHIWNETMQVELFELYASIYADAGLMREAGIFKRAAHRSFQSITEWIRPDGTGYIVKNRYPIEAEHGYEVYSTHTNYNLLAMSQLATAYQVANDAISEQATPAELGGFVFDLESDHRNNMTIFPWTIANVAGNYLTIIRQRDGAGYDSTGLIRVFLRDGNPRLGPAASVSPKFSGRGNFIAVGPTWENAAGKRVSLAELRPDKSELEVLEANPNRVVFIITYQIPGGTLTEAYEITPDGLTVIDTIQGEGLKNIGVQFPALVFDGEATTEIQLEGNRADLSLGDNGVIYEIISPEANFQREERSYGHVNGLADRIHAQTTGKKILYRIEAQP